MFFRKQKSAGNDNLPATTQPTVIAAGMHVDGNLTGDGEIQIEGSVTGIVQARRCVVTAQGRVQGEIRGDDVTVHGEVKGPIRAHHVHLMSDSEVEGDISCETIAIETGARLSGAVWQDGRTAQRDIREPEVASPPALFSDSLWGSREDSDAFRPLKAIRPRAGSLR